MSKTRLLGEKEEFPNHGFVIDPQQPSGSSLGDMGAQQLTDSGIDRSLFLSEGREKSSARKRPLTVPTQKARNSLAVGGSFVEAFSDPGSELGILGDETGRAAVQAAVVIRA